MYKTTQDNSDFMNRTGSHATKGSKRGIIRDIPLSAVQALQDECEAIEWKINQYLATVPKLKQHVRQITAHIANIKKAAIANINCYQRRKAANRKSNSKQLQRAYHLLTTLLHELSQLQRLINTIKPSGRLNPCMASGGLLKPVHGVLAPPQSSAWGNRPLLQSDALAPMKGGAPPPCTGYLGYGQYNSHHFNDYERGD